MGSSLIRLQLRLVSWSHLVLKQSPICSSGNIPICSWPNGLISVRENDISLLGGGVSDGPVVIEELKRRQFRQLKITTIKQPLPNEGTLRYYLPNSSNKDPTTQTKEDQITNTTTTTTDASSTITHGSKNNTVTNGDDSLLETTPPQQKQKQPQQYPLTCAATTF